MNIAGFLSKPQVHCVCRHTTRHDGERVELEDQHEGGLKQSRLTG